MFLNYGIGDMNDSDNGGLREERANVQTIHRLAISG
jgi:hypothetical protein